MLRVGVQTSWAEPSNAWFELGSIAYIHIELKLTKLVESQLKLKLQIEMSGLSLDHKITFLTL